jgi:hypothetical protein
MSEVVFYLSVSVPIYLQDLVLDLHSGLELDFSFDCGFGFDWK